MRVNDPLAALRARRLATAVAEADQPSALDPNDPERWGLDPDALHDWAGEDSL